MSTNQLVDFSSYSLSSMRVFVKVETDAISRRLYSLKEKPVVYDGAA